jgi:valyl-tRNA synthetase
MDLRPQAHDIIRTWLFSTVVRSHFEFDVLPWKNAYISGWILDPDRKKMSKSVGNVVTPMPLLEQHGADAVRYWAACGRPGTDTAIDEGQMKIGRRLAIKILNASKFVLGRLEGAEETSTSDVSEPLDLDLLALLSQLIVEATTAFDNYDNARVLEKTEVFFWSFCDNYVELVKIRAYGEDDSASTRSARATLSLTLSVLQRMLAPFVPFVSEEVWRWWHTDSVHLTSWPTRDELALSASETEPGSLYNPVCDVLEAIRRAKSTAKVSQRAEVSLCSVSGPVPLLDAVRACQADLEKAGGVLAWELHEASDVVINVTLATD